MDLSTSGGGVKIRETYHALDKSIVFAILALLKIDMLRAEREVVRSLGFPRICSQFYLMLAGIEFRNLMPRIIVSGWFHLTGMSSTGRSSRG